MIRNGEEDEDWCWRAAELAQFCRVVRVPASSDHGGDTGTTVAH